MTQGRLSSQGLLDEPTKLETVRAVDHQDWFGSSLSPEGKNKRQGTREGRLPALGKFEVDRGKEIPMRELCSMRKNVRFRPSSPSESDEERFDLGSMPTLATVKSSN